MQPSALRAVPRSSALTLWLVIAGLLLTSVPGWALEIDAELLARAKSAQGPMDLMILLADRPDMEKLEASLAGSSFESRRDRVMAALREHARKSQAGLLDELADAVAQGEASEVRSLWLVNAVFVEGQDALLQRLAAYPAEGWVGPNPRLAMVEAAAMPSRTGKPANLDGRVEDISEKANPTVWSVEWINAPAAWAQGYDGSGVLIGHLDSGAWLEHPDLVNRLWTNEGEIPGNGIDDDGNGYVDDVHGWDFGDRDSDPTDDAYDFAGGGHGTHTAGTVVGDGSGGLNTGVAPGAKIIVCKPTWSSDGTASSANIFEAQQYAIMMGARLMTMSLGAVGGAPASVLQAERYDGDALRLLGVPLITSSGNAHGDLPTLFELTTTARVPSPWNEDPAVPYSSRSGIIAVGATAYQSDTIWPRSSQGPADWGFVPPWNDWSSEEGNGLVKPDISAPGNGISSLVRPAGYSQTNWSGTSMACPHVSGVVALMLQKNPSLMPEDIDRILQQSAVDLGDPGKDNVFGAGRVDALAAVNAVPAVARPSLLVADYQIVDEDGNGTIDPGESFELSLEILNNSFTTDAQQVIAFISVVGDPMVQVIDSTAQLGAIPFGASAESGTALRLIASADAEQGREFTVTVGLVAQDGYWTANDLHLSVGLPELRTHRTQGLRLTITDRGTIGFWDMNQVEGWGVVPAGGSNMLWAGGFWGGNSIDYVCNRDYVPTDPTEWELVTEPNGRLALAAPALADENYTAIFDDAGHEQPKGIRVTQHSLSWMDEDAADFVILRYEIQNTSSETINGYRAGVFMDWDFGNPFYTRADRDAGRDLVWVEDVYVTQGFAGVRVLTPMGDPALAVINNPTFVHPNLQISDDNKWRIMSGSLDTVVGDVDDDYSTLAGTGSFDLAPGETVQVAFAVVYGSSLEDLQANADLAAARNASIPTGVEGTPVRNAFALGQNTPNPFNPVTSIHFELARSGPARLTVLDARGRVVRVLTEGTQGAGSHVVRWDGVDQSGDRVSSGVYFYRLETEEYSSTRKMVMVK